MNFKAIWKDPVLSQLIGAGLVAVIGALVISFVPDWQNRLVLWLTSRMSIPHYYIIIITLLIMIGFIIIKSKKSKNNKTLCISSSQWFNEIERQIKDCKFARIYLRGFAHPDQFRPEHRDSLLSFMQSLAKRLDSGADIEIIAYHYSQSDKSGLDWLKTELKQKPESTNKIKLIPTQPVSNSSSMYLFDSGIVLYNRRINDGNSYHIENLQGSIVHYLLGRGFCIEKGIK